MLESGQTFAIGGLIENQRAGDRARRCRSWVTCRSSAAAFSSVSYQERETELLILVTPRLVDPMDCNQVPPPGAGQGDPQPGRL